MERKLRINIKSSPSYLGIKIDGEHVYDITRGLDDNREIIIYVNGEKWSPPNETKED